jgi:16S rRNA (cytidine1402-2'-O)-methyltransferase
MRNKKGSLFLLPSPIADQTLHSIPLEAIQILHRLDHFIVERARTSRRYISSTKPEKTIDSLSIVEMPDDLTNQVLIQNQLQPLLEGHDMGILSEAGLPAVADPGNRYVAVAHSLGIRVVPISGPSSIMMALIASGLEGQRFSFHGYLSAKREEVEHQLPLLEKRAQREDATQIWIEAPYRNRQILEAAAKFLDKKTMFCIASGLGGKDGFVLTRNIASWQRSGWPEIHKVPTVFLLK